MKILKLCVCALAVFTITACSSDDDSSTPVVELTIANLTGTYELTFYEDFYEETETASNGSVVVIETETCVGDTFTNAIVTFNSDGTFMTSGNYREVCDFTANGQTTTENDIVPFDSSGSYSANDTSRTIAFNGFVNNVVLFDGTNLYLTSTEVETIDDETYRFETEVRFRKQN